MLRSISSPTLVWPSCVVSAPRMQSLKFSTRPACELRQPVSWQGLRVNLDPLHQIPKRMYSKENFTLREPPPRYISQSNLHKTLSVWWYQTVRPRRKQDLEEHHQMGRWHQQSYSRMEAGDEEGNLHERFDRGHHHSHGLDSSVARCSAAVRCASALGTCIR